MKKAQPKLRACVPIETFASLCEKRMKAGRRVHGDYRKLKPNPLKWLKELKQEAADITNYSDMAWHSYQAAGGELGHSPITKLVKIDRWAQRIFDLATEIQAELEKGELHGKR